LFVDTGGVKGKCADLQASLKELATLAKTLVKPENDNQLESLGDIVEQEMVATSAVHLCLHIILADAIDV
jgi:hypothetical protein